MSSSEIVPDQMCFLSTSGLSERARSGLARLYPSNKASALGAG